MTHRIARALSVVLTAGLLTTIAGPSPAATPDTVATAKDKRGDVRINHAVKGVPAQERRSIDLQRATISRHGRKVRFEVQIRQILLHEEFVETAIFQLDPVQGSDFYGAGVLLRPRWTKSFGEIAYDNVYEHLRTCDHLKSRADLDGGRFWVDVPRRCVPATKTKVRAFTNLGGRHSDWVASRDSLKLPDRYVLR